VSIITHFVSRHAWALALAVLVVVGPAAQGMMHPERCCVGPVGENACTQPAPSAASGDDCCQDDENRETPAPAQPGDQVPCDCTCCDMLVLSPRVTPVDTEAHWLSDGPTSLVAITTRRAPESLVVGVDIQPPIV